MHPQARSFDADIQNLITKFQSRRQLCHYLLFYNAESYLYLRDALEKRGIDTTEHRLIAGIMPIINSSNLIRFVDS